MAGGGERQELEPQNSNPCAVSTELLTAPATTYYNSEPVPSPSHKHALALPQPQEVGGKKREANPRQSHSLGGSHPTLLQRPTWSYSANARTGSVFTVPPELKKGSWPSPAPHHAIPNCSVHLACCSTSKGSS